MFGLSICILQYILTLAEEGRYETLKEFTTSKIQLFEDFRNEHVMNYLRDALDDGFFDGAVSDLFEIMRAHDLTFAKKSDNEDCED